MTMMANMTTLTTLATKKSIEEMKADLTERFIKRTLEIMEIANGFDEYVFDYEAQIAENYRLIVVAIHFSQTEKKSAQDKVLRLIESEVRQSA